MLATSDVLCQLEGAGLGVSRRGSRAVNGEHTREKEGEGGKEGEHDGGGRGKGGTERQEGTGWVNRWHMMGWGEGWGERKEDGNANVNSK